MLRVIQAFASHAVGDDITDVSAIEEIIASDHASFVVRVADPAPDATPSATDKE